MDFDSYWTITYDFPYGMKLNTGTGSHTGKNKNDGYGKMLRANVVSRTGRTRKWDLEDI